jgi:hypothetical protein
MVNNLRWCRVRYVLRWSVMSRSGRMQSAYACSSARRLPCSLNPHDESGVPQQKNEAVGSPTSIRCTTIACSCAVGNPTVVSSAWYLSHGPTAYVAAATSENRTAFHGQGSEQRGMPSGEPHSDHDQALCCEEYGGDEKGASQRPTRRRPGAGRRYTDT